MKNNLIILLLLASLVSSQTYSITPCKCEELMSEGDCNKQLSLGCSWDNTKKTCQISTTPVAPTVTYAAYCDNFSETDCPKAKPCTNCGSYGACAWVDSKCKYFTGCTPFAKVTDSDCQAISNRCITDGVHCVEIDDCTTYKKQQACVKNVMGKLCFWDTISNTCVDANTCDKLPITITTDKNCRDIISTCTTKNGGGCIDSGDNCGDQKLQIQCVWDKLRINSCYWDGAICKDRTCDNAPISLITDDTCKQFRVDGTCTTKVNGGCVTRTNCSAATIQAACIKNNLGEDCYWTGNACVDKTCSNAPLNLTSNSACAGFATGCITKTGGGCIINGGCSVANMQTACVMNSTGFDCIWDNGCKEKTCQNAQTSNNTHELCTTYLKTCTVKLGGGCQDRTCLNAPTSVNTNDACESYLPGQKCITKSGGGCVVNTTCSAIAQEIACIKNQSNQACFWDSASQSCKDKTCLNAPTSNNSHDLCQQFLNTCTVNKAGAGCVEKTCENSLVSAICDKDKANRNCIWKGKCYKKQCALASSNITSHDDCQTYHLSCTLNNTGFGCINLPLKCEAITIQSACQIKANGQKCGWNGSQCIDKACSTASKTLTTTSECQSHLPTCVANNPVSGVIQGCQDLPTTCAARKSSDNCEIARKGFPTCLWVSSTKICVEKSCATANSAGTTGALSAGGFTFNGCQNYLILCTANDAQGNCTNTAKPCISNNNQDGCINKPSSCNNLNSQNCQQGSKANGDCYWNGSSCVDRTCANLFVSPFTFENCNSEFDQCTLNNVGNGCQPLATACQSYSTQENCKIIVANKRCIWTGQACRNATCADALNTEDYDTDSECQAFLTASDTCTVQQSVGGKGCVQKQAKCSDYQTQTQCHKTIKNLTLVDDCKWVVGRCYDLSTFATGPCSKFKGTQTMCQAYRLGCTNVVGATSSTNCTLDCTLKTGIGFMFQDCQALDVTCSVKKNGSGCLTIQLSCSGYTSDESCFQSNTGLCFWNGSSCGNVTQGSECTNISGVTGLDHAKCQAYHPSCTSLNDGTGCQEFQQTCGKYLGNSNSCTISVQGKCFLNGTNCIRIQFCSQIVSKNYQEYYCKQYNSNCITNIDYSSCISKKISCSDYYTQSTCIKVEDTFKCAWIGTQCIKITNPAVECAQIVSTYTIDHFGCQNFNPGCTGISTFNGCQEFKATCADYSTQRQCMMSKETNPYCVWNGTTCVQFTNPDTDCPLIPHLKTMWNNFCNLFNNSCYINLTFTKCFKKQDTCEQYLIQENCRFSVAGNCIWNGSSCITFVDAATSCHLKTGTNLDLSICNSISNNCTVNKSRTSCIQSPDSCSSADESSCTWISKDGQQLKYCFWIDSTCKELSGDQQTCSLLNQVAIPSFYPDTCGYYHSDCIRNYAGDNCQAKLGTCAEYLIQSRCSISKDQGYCFWNGTSCIAIQNASDCIYITNLTTNSQCDYIFSGCCVNSQRTGCQEAKAACNQYLTQLSCSFVKTGSSYKSCFWNGSACVDFSNPKTQCVQMTGTNLIHDICQTQNSDCTALSDGTGCQFWQTQCKDYNTQNECTTQKDSKYCSWFQNSCQQDIILDCSYITGSGLDHTKCQAMNLSCTYLSNGNACQDYLQNCELYPGTPLACTMSQQGKCYLNNANKCITILNPSTDCAKITGSAGTITYEICQSFNIECSVNRAKSACVQQKAQCSDYNTSMDNCYRSGAGLCIGSTSSDTACVAASNASTCAAVVLGNGNYNHDNCKQFKEGCISDGTSCVTKSCSNATGVSFNHLNCNNWLNSCTVNSGNTACVAMKQNCSDQTSALCLRSIEGECHVVGTQCIKKTCESAPADDTNDDDTECSTYLQSCTVAKIGACQVRTACNLYKSQLQCKFNQNGQQCFWNPTNRNCVDLRCENIETTSLFDSHNECVAINASLACTVRAANEAAVPGCMSRGPCNSYTIEQQCKKNQNEDTCVWNTNQPKAVCLDKSCTSAPNTFTTHNQCVTYHNTQTVKCTVFATPNNSGGEASLGGCQQVAACSSYIHKEQCQINANGDNCGWNGTKCDDKSCLTAPATEYDDDTKCRAYLNNQCTVADSGQGCVEIPITCEIMTEKQCTYNKAGDRCYWTGTACITRSCDNAPEATATADECNTYLPGCTLDDVKCKTKICEDFPYSTDAQCKQAFPTCTTNGTYCVIRGTCVQALNQAGCITSSTDQQCEWIPAILNAQNQVTTPAFCTVKTCNTAPLTFTSEAACAGYFTNCTTKLGGGCVVKSTCSDVTIDTACTTALNGTACAWDYTQKKCKDKDCQDFSGSTHAVCFAQRNGCTVGSNGKCARVQNCEQTTIRAACIEGANGPCLWVDKYQNADGTQGACFQYTSCKSLTWNTDDQCKLISDKCTTNGTNCVGINLCSETNTNGGCVTGYDGNCIQLVPSLNSIDAKFCKLYSSCNDAFYTTHQECQIANKKCTTNGITGCISLASCSSYTSQAGCYLNDKGIEYKSEAIVSTGICVWDTTASACRDQSCNDLIGMNHTTCSSQLSTCTSDGSKCLLKGACQSYTTQTACTIAIGSDGTCYWELASITNNNTAKCRLLTCADIQNGTTTNVCLVALSSCISNGTACIPKAQCQTYKTRSACSSGGLDGICVFTQSNIATATTANAASFDIGTCQLMNSCSVANNDQTACQAAKDRCSWISSAGTSTKCTPHTCATNQATNGLCSQFLNWDKQTQQFCTLLDNKCTSIDPQSLSSNDCLQVSGYTYSWNSQTNKCLVCYQGMTQPNSTVNNTINDTNNTTTDSEYILGLSTIIFGYIIF